MREITAYDTAGYPIISLAQYDRDVTVCVKDIEIDKKYPMHFCNSRSQQAYVVDATFEGGTLKAKIPNALLEQDRYITGYVYATKADERKSILAFVVQVAPRPRPSDALYEDERDYVNLTDALAECRAKAAAAEKSKQGADSAKQAAETAKTQATAAKDEATRQASAAAASKTAAETAKTQAETAKNTATTQANTAKAQADAAAKSATEAKLAAQVATGIKQITQSLVVGTWQGSASPYTYTINISGLTATQLVYVSANFTGKNATEVQKLIDAFADACITAKEQKAGSIVLQAVNKPTMDLPVVIEVGGEPTNG